jgi:hypothetical protein
MRRIVHSISGVDKATAVAAVRESLWGSGAFKRTEYQNLWWVLSNWFPFRQKAVFWIPAVISGSKFSNNCRGGG